MNEAADSVQPRAELTVREVANVMGWSVRRAKRDVARWFVRGWPRVRLEPCRGNHRGRYLVDLDSFERFCSGEIEEEREAA